MVGEKGPKLTSARILVVEDEDSIQRLVAAYLESEGFQVRTANDGRSGLEQARAWNPDVIVLDIMLPQLDGLELLSRLRRESSVYVILLTAKTEETDKLVGLTMGADDYLTKPFSPRELVARVKAALRRLRGAAGPGEHVLVFARLRIDADRRQVTIDDRPVDLTAVEFDILWALAEHGGKVLSREQILERVWGHDYFGELRVVDVHVGHIRKKLQEDELIATVRGVGYRLDDNPAGAGEAV